MNKDNETPFRVISGGKDIKPGRVGKAESGLTLKQEAFAQGLAEGKTNSESYRNAYNCDDMAQSTVHEHACRLAASDKIRTRVEALLAAKAVKTQHVALKNEDRVWKGIWELAEGEDTPPAVKATALGLAARMSGLFNDKLTIDAPSSASDLERELAERLAKYAK
jgi:hypothetical protein